MNKFDDLGLAEPILRALKAEGYKEPTPIQTKVIPSMLEMKDVIGIAQTGTGKTAAFVLPILDRVLKERIVAAPKGCTCLILSPTRELAAQITETARTYGKFMQLAVVPVVGGVRHGPQIKAMSKGADILVATPGRLLDHIAAGAIHLGQTRTIIIDEADQMLDLGFLKPIRDIISLLPKSRQSVLMSATMPKQIRKLANDILTRPEEISVAPTARPIERIAQSVVHVERTGKRAELTKILKDEAISQAIVFVRTKRGADRVNKHLKQEGLSAAAIHGDKTQKQRERSLAQFRAGKHKVLVATDIAARGIDIDDVSHVVNYELPNVPEAYVHRIGRTARAGRSGTAISLCDKEEMKLLRDIERLIGTQLSNSFEPCDEGSAEKLLKENQPLKEESKEPRSEPKQKSRWSKKKKQRHNRKNTAGNAGNESRKNTENNAGNKTGNNAGNKTAGKPQGKTGNKANNKTGHKVRNRADNKPANNNDKPHSGKPNTRFQKSGPKKATDSLTRRASSRRPNRTKSAA